MYGNGIPIAPNPLLTPDATAAIVAAAAAAAVSNQFANHPFSKNLHLLNPALMVPIAAAAAPAEKSPNNDDDDILDDGDGGINLTAEQRASLRKKLSRDDVTASSPSMTNFVALSNCFDPTKSDEEYFKEIELDIAEECAGYGEVRRLVLVRSDTPKAKAGTVLIEFGSVDAAACAISKLKD
jgi:hypothetical protein